jgi:Domain of unknown function (DUF397)
MPSRQSRHFTPAWRKSKFSTGANTCVEIGDVAPVIFVRDSCSPETTLAFSAAQWSAFMQRIRKDNGHSAG